jgi:phosphate transport system substrate-binding protein
MAALENKSGTYVKADPASEKAALASVELPPDLRAWIPDPGAPGAYPIVTYTWILAYKKYADPKIKDALKNVLRYGLSDGQKLSDELGYIPLPDNVVTAVTKALDQIT